MDVRGIEILRALACDYEQQLKLFPTYVQPADELAQQFSDLEDVYLQPDDEFAPDVAKYLKALRASFDELQAKDAENAWTAEALKSSAIWEKVRIDARSMLEELEAEFRTPDLGFLTFVPAKAANNKRPWLNSKLPLAYGVRQVIFTAIIALFAWWHYSRSGDWMGWPAIVASAAVLNVMWCFVA